METTKKMPTTGAGGAASASADPTRDLHAGQTDEVAEMLSGMNG